MAAADPGRLHAARGGEVGRPEAHAVHARRGGRDRLDVVDALGGLQDGVDEDRLSHLVPGLELGEKLVEIVDVPRAVDLRQHHHVELVADRRHDFGHVVERPGAVEAVDAHPQGRVAEVVGARRLDEAGPRRPLGVGRYGVLQVAQQHVHVADHVGHLGAHLLHLRRKEMDHALEPDRQLAQGRGRADGERTVEACGQFHRTPPWLAPRLGRTRRRDKPAGRD
jgi:hypothetical protein